MPHPITRAQLWSTFTRIGLLSFGGPAGQIAVMHRILVEERRWLGESRFLHALAYCMVLPGPEAQQLCTYAGWLLRGTWGGIIAGALFVLPGFLAILALSLLYLTAGHTPGVQALFAGLQPAVVALVVVALLRLGGRALRSRMQWALAVGGGLSLALGLPFPLLILAAILFGWFSAKSRPGWFPPAGHKASATAPEPMIPDAALHCPDASPVRTLGRCLLWLGLWLAPLAAIAAILGNEHVLSRIGWFFSQVAVVTIGGAYAVLPYVAEHAVHTHHWLSPTDMIAGLGLAESTPGPLIMVVQFVGALGAHAHPGGLPPLWAAVAGSIIATWATFMPSYLYIFAGAPVLERWRSHAALGASLAAVSAVVVGVIGNLAVWFALHVVFTAIDRQTWHGLAILVPDPASFQVVPAVLAVACGVALIRFRLGLGWVLGGSILLGGGWHWWSLL